MRGIAGLTWETAEEMDIKLAERVKNIRKRRKITQAELSTQSGVSLGSIRRFEQSGQISLLSLTKLSLALDCGDQIRDMFTDIPYRDIQEVINENR